MHVCGYDQQSFLWVLYSLAQFLVSIARTYAQYTNGCLHRPVLASGQGFVRTALVSSIMVEPDLHAQKQSTGSDTCDASITLLCNTSVMSTA